MTRSASFVISILLVEVIVMTMKKSIFLCSSKTCKKVGELEYIRETFFSDELSLVKIKYID